MVRHVAPIAIGAAVGWLVASFLDGLAALLVIAAMVALWLGYCKVWVRRRYAQRYLAYARKHLDQDAGPPPDAEPVDLPLARRMDEIPDSDFDAVRLLYTEDCRFYVVGRK